MKTILRPLSAPLLLLVLAGAADAAQWQGRVFDDRDGDGMAGAGEPGIHGVTVSGGHSVALTDAGGRYRLPLRADAVVFVVKPAGWQAGVRSDGLPAVWHGPAAAGSE